MASRNLVWTGFVSTDFGTAGNWDDITDSLNPAAFGPTSVDTTFYVGGAGNITGSGAVSGLGFDNGGTWTLNGAIISASNGVTIASQQSSTVTLQAGATLTSTGTTTIATASGSLASVTLMGSGTELLQSGFLFIGQSGNANVTVENNAVINIDPTSVANFQVEIGGTGTLVTGGSADFGGTGTLEIFSGGTFEITAPASTSSAFELGVTPASGNIAQGIGSLDVNGTGSLLNLNDNSSPQATGGNAMEVGVYGRGYATVEAGATAEVGTAVSNTLAALQVAMFNGSTGTITVTGLQSTMSVIGTANIGRAGTGALIVSNAGTLSTTLDPSGSGDVDIGSGNPNFLEDGQDFGSTGNLGTGTVTAGGVINSAGSVIIGRYGTSGLLTIDTNGVVTAANRVLLGLSEVVNGTSYTANGTIDVGSGGTLIALGSLVNTSGTSTISVGANAGSNGVLNVSGGLVSTDYNGQGGSLSIGGNGNGSVTVSQSGTIIATTLVSSSAAVTIGSQVGSTGTLVVTGGKSTFNSVGGLNIGNSGTGSVTLEAAGTIDSGGDENSGYQDEGLTIGRSADSAGSLTVEGARSLLTNIGRFEVGGTSYFDNQVGGTGTVTISAGGEIHTSLPSNYVNSSGGVNGFTPVAAAEIGASSGSSGSSVTVTGLGSNAVASTWQIDGALYVAAGGNASLNVAQGGQVNATYVDLAHVAGITATGSVDGSGSAINDSGTLLVGDVGTATLGISNYGLVSASSATIGSSVSTSASGTVNLSSGGGLQVTNTLTVAGTLSVANGAGIIAASSIIGTGKLNIGTNGEMVLQGSNGGSDPGNLSTLLSINYSDSTGSLYLNNPSDLTNVSINNFTQGDIVGIGEVFNSESLVGTQLTLYAGTNGQNPLGVLDFATGTSAQAILSGVIEAQAPSCFTQGTRIRMPDGEVAVEDLREGDWALTHSGQPAPVIWIGSRVMRRLRRHPRPDTVQPVRIRAGALADGVPSRDLVVSPDHAIYLDGHLIPAKVLINGASVAQLDMEEVTYFHVELDTHAILLAESTPAESYLDTGNRHDFEGGAVLALHPSFNQHRREAEGCAPFAEAGPVVERVRARILARAAIAMTEDAWVKLERMADGIAIRSRSAVPGHLTPDPRDRRVLGVKIAALHVDGRAIALDDRRLTSGWHDVEADGRWTDGMAMVPASLADRPSRLRVTLAASQRYQVAAPEWRSIAANR
jgi:T5SS/PEP-CTERM-associated repeat protein